MISPGENKRIGKHVRRLRNQSQSISSDQYTGRGEREVAREGARETRVLTKPNKYRRAKRGEIRLVLRESKHNTFNP